MNPRRRQATGRGASCGFTLLEITIILAVIAILGLILAPSIVSFLNQSRLARAQNDVEILADAVVDFFRDNGFFPQYADAERSRRIDLLVSAGAVPDVQSGAEGWAEVAPDRLDRITNQLINNRPSFSGRGYPLKTAASGSGWNGPYMSADLQADPWGNRYMVNVEFLSVMPDAVEADGVQQKRAVWALSAGPDGTVDTLYPDAARQLVSNAAASPLDISKRIQ